MSTGDLLRIEPQELQFPLELRKLISCSLQLSNETDNYVAFKVMTTKPKKYFVRPNTEIVLPWSTCDVKVTMQAQTEAPPDMNCKDKLLFQSVTASPGATAKDITREMVIIDLSSLNAEINLTESAGVGFQFNAEPGRDVKECKWEKCTKRGDDGAALRWDTADVRGDRSSPKRTSKWNRNRVQTSPSRSHVLSLRLSLSLSCSLRLRSLSRRRSPQGEVPPPPPPPPPPPICPRGSAMGMGDLLRIEPQELQFAFELRKQISCSLQLSNKTDSYVAFKVKTTNPKKYCVRPNTGIIFPRSTCDVIVTMQAQKEAPLDMNCKDKFLLQSVTASPGASTKDITPEMFNKESGHNVEECKLRVVYVAPPRPPSPVREGSEEGSSPRASISDNGNLNNFEFTAASKTFDEPQDNSSEAKALILKLTEEKNSAIQLNNKLQQELELLKRQTKRGHGGISFIYVVLIGLLGLILGYLMKRT
ncbi:vesicle-associated protein 1-1-like [Rhodamnia argentea]|uniref:Vesicle-associated protein 1-1-like n=1 Tax=Rhodamnia argentea TaxID=178133 RepID=A0ABM3HXY0_9MYRT|nr:vesicle-associated protein 1-1-like [Rhodamnia argentea]